MPELPTHLFDSPADFEGLIDYLYGATRQIIDGSLVSDETILRRYGVYANGSFTDMMGWTYMNARHEQTRYTIHENLRCEKVQDHPGMMLDLLRQAGVQPDEDAMNHIASIMQKVRDLQRNPKTIGLVGTMHFAVIENTSLVFVPDIGQRAKRLGASDLTYVEIHGEADIEHAKAFIRATEAEATMDYDYTPLAQEATRLMLSVLETIYH